MGCITTWPVNIVIGLIAVLTYMWVAKKYKYRERDEICEVHRYAEEYYSNPQQEQYYNEPPDISSLAIHSVQVFVLVSD